MRIPRGTYGGYVLMNLGATYKLSETMSIDLQLKNLTNRYYEYVWYDPDGADASLHSPGDGRALYAEPSISKKGSAFCLVSGLLSQSAGVITITYYQLSGVGGSVPSSETAATAATPQNHSTRMLVRST